MTDTRERAVPAAGAVEAGSEHPIGWPAVAHAEAAGTVV